MSHQFHALDPATGAPIEPAFAVSSAADVDAVAIAHGRVFGEIKPANTLIVVAGLIGGYKVEIEADALVAK